MVKIHVLTKILFISILLFSNNAWGAFTCGVNPSNTVEVGEEFTYWFDAGMFLDSKYDIVASVNGSAYSMTMPGVQKYFYNTSTMPSVPSP